jgi:arsenate reductase
MIKVLVVCSGNAVRSQMAEGYFNFYGQNLGLFFSAGIQKRDINPYAKQVMAEDNIDLSEHLSKSINAFKDVNFDHVITVCDPSDKKFLDELDFQQWHHHPVPDPTKLRDQQEADILQNFRVSRELIKRMVLKFIGQELIPSEVESSYP